ncbi:unnamed protein product [Blepharisma stoltei]|uniref:Uncharacterized protein n=1 Tax=Blepharisma stoltei TaxID=1481888 RepID=A0AAU9K7H7_9CILI|nr:unnamed protein product [Blepharisma stoltei]
MNPSQSHLYSNNQQRINYVQQIIEEVPQFQSQETGSIYIKIDPVPIRKNKPLHPPKVFIRIEDSNTAINRITQESVIKCQIDQNSLILYLDKIKSDTMIEVQAIRNEFNLKNHQIEMNEELQIFQNDIQLKVHQAFLDRDLERFKLEGEKEMEELRHNLQLEINKSESLIKDAQNRLDYEIKMIMINSNREIEEFSERISKEIALSAHETDKIIENYKQEISIKIEQAKSKTNIEIERIMCETAIKIAKIESKNKMWELGCDFVTSFIPGKAILDKFTK